MNSDTGRLVWRHGAVIFLLTLLCIQTQGQCSKPVVINWVKQLSGDFSFVKKWSYPLGVEKKADGKAGCGDGGFCPERCYSMLDSNGIVMEDSAGIFYQLLDTTHLFHSLQCQAYCPEWDGSDFLYVNCKSRDSVYCRSSTGISTHCSLELTIVKDSCFASIDLLSILDNGDATYCCTGGAISIDQKLWKKGIMKAEFDFQFEKDSPDSAPNYWKGKVYAKIEE